MKWYLHSCPVCGGDMHDDVQDPGWVVCFMCTRTFPVEDVLGRLHPGTPHRVGTGLRRPATQLPYDDVERAGKQAA